uniref:Uncharacterized protein n=1 Tax=Timema shepardi TaxID=629360 RepID=A0A7R9AL36_TIMSH|nr:unnamed protein product [Timema shepardi]
MFGFVCDIDVSLSPDDHAEEGEADDVGDCHHSGCAGAAALESPRDHWSGRAKSLARLVIANCGRIKPEEKLTLPHSPIASLVLSDSSQLTADGFEKLPDQIMYPYAEPYDLWSTKMLHDAQLVRKKCLTVPRWSTKMLHNAQMASRNVSRRPSGQQDCLTAPIWSEMFHDAQRPEGSQTSSRWSGAVAFQSRSRPGLEPTHEFVRRVQGRSLGGAITCRGTSLLSNACKIPHRCVRPRGTTT